MVQESSGRRALGYFGDCSFGLLYRLRADPPVIKIDQREQVLIEGPAIVELLEVQPAARRYGH